MVEENEKSEKGKDLSKFDWTESQINAQTYKWQFYSKKHQYYIEYSDDSLYEKGISIKDNKEVECVKIELYKSPMKPVSNVQLRDAHLQLGLRVLYFKEVFEEHAFEDGYEPQHKYVRLHIPSDIHSEILNVINDFELLHIRNLLLEIIATAQDTYISDVVFWERPESQKLITTAEKETAKAIQVIEQASLNSEPFNKFKGKVRPQLDHINFVFNTGPIKLEHQLLAGEFIEHMKRTYDDMFFKDWKKELARYPLGFEENAYKSKFKYRLAKSYYNLFTKAKFFDVQKEQPYPNRLMLCIAKLIEFSLIPVGDLNETDEIKVKHIRNWLTRNDLEPKITFAKVPANLERLKNYFEPNFIDIANELKRADAISVAIYICDRFQIPELLPDFIHIASCIDQTNLFFRNQMTSNYWENETDIPEMNALRQLMNGVKDKKKLTSIKFIIDGDETEHTLTQRLPLYLIEEALKEYYQSNLVEFDMDAIPTTFKKNDKDHLTIDRAIQLNLPHERHLVRLVHSLYNFLKDHSGLEEGNVQPGEQYYQIIGIIFNQTRVFYEKRVDDRSYIEKIKQWHKLSPES